MDHYPFTHPSRSGIYRISPASRAEVLAEARRRMLSVCVAELSGTRETGEVLRRIGQSAEFPEWYGASFDGLADCLGDAELSSGSGQAIVITGHAGWRDAKARDYAVLLEVLSGACVERRTSRSPLWVLIENGPMDLPEFTGG